MMGGGGISFWYVERDISRRSSLQMINAIQQALAPVGQTCVYNRADGFGYVTPARECGPINRGDAPGVSAMRTYSIVTSCGLLAAVMSSAAQAAVVQMTIQGGPNSGFPALVGIAAKINYGQVSIQSITGAQVANSVGQMYGLPSGFSQQTLASSFMAGGVTANSSQYGFVRGGGGSIYSNANAADVSSSGFGYTVTCLLDAGYTPVSGDTFNLITTTFKQTGDLFIQTNHIYTFNGGTSVWDRTNGADPYAWVQSVSGSFDQLSAAVVPAPGALALLGVAGLAGGRRRRA